jgi:hypothetical protein
MRKALLHMVGLLALVIICTESVSGTETHRRLETPAFRFGDQITIPTLDDDTDTLIADNGNPYYVFRFPDAYGDDLRNQWFQMPNDALIAGVMIGFVKDAEQAYSTGDPDLELIIWESAGDSLPDSQAVLLRDTTSYAEYAANVYDMNDEWTEAPEQFVIVDLRDHGLFLSALDEFHVGYSAILNSADDSLAILADRPSRESFESSEWYNGEFHHMLEVWRGVNFFIRVIIETPSGTVILPEGRASIADYKLLRAYPNPFNAQTNISIELVQTGYLSVEAYDIMGRQVATLFKGNAPQARMTIPLNAEAWSSGAYFIHLSTPTEHSALRVILQK